MATFPLDDAFKIFQLLFASILEENPFVEACTKISLARLKPIARIDQTFLTLLKTWIWHRMEGKRYYFLSDRMKNLNDFDLLKVL